MNKFIAFILMTLGGIAYSVATTIKSPAVSALGNVKYSLFAYKLEKGRFPNSWDELTSSGHLSGITLVHAREYCDIENRYFLFDGGIKVNDFGKKINILIMAKSSGLEGDHTGSPDGVGAKGRFIFIEGPNNSVETRRCSEVELNRIFSDSGLKLSDYTITSHGSGNDETSTNSSGGSTGATQRQDTLRASKASNSQWIYFTFQSYWKWLLSGIGLLGAGYFLCKRFKASS